MTSTSVDQVVIQNFLNEFQTSSWICSDKILPQKWITLIQKEFDQSLAVHKFCPSAFGDGSSKARNTSIRGDWTTWVNFQTDFWKESGLTSFFNDLQNCLNQTFYLNIKHFDGHFAYYPPETGYAKHMDNPKGHSHRSITLIIYLNRNWLPQQGGQLSLFDSLAPQRRVAQIDPLEGRFLMFDSRSVPHQVEISHFYRRSFSLWFRDDAL